MNGETLAFSREGALALLALDVAPHQVTEEMRVGARLAVEELRFRVEQTVRWDRARPLLAELRAETIEWPHSARASVDQLQAYATARLAQLGIDIRDRRVLYEVLVILSLVNECSRNGHDNGLLNDDEDSAIRGLLRALGRAFAQLVPPGDLEP